MRGRTLVVVALIVVLLAGVGVTAFTASEQSRVTIEVLWVSDTATSIGGNHHAPVAGILNGSPMVYAPISGRSDTRNCALVGLDGTTGEQRWSYPVPPMDCTIHSVADPTLADYDSDGTTEVLAATTEQAVIAMHPITGAVEFRYNLSAYGYTKPIVADFVGDERPEIVVVDVNGAVFVLNQSGDLVWQKQLSAYTWGQPTIGDYDGDRAPELAVATGGTGQVYVFDQNGSLAWSTPQSVPGSITWMTTGDAAEEPGEDIVVTTASTGLVTLVEGATGDRVWTRDFGRFAAVKAFGDGDQDGAPEVYAVARDGVLRSLDARTGATEWTTTLTTADVQMMPPPVFGDVVGDDAPELVAATNDGIVAVIDPTTGDVVGSYARDGAIYTQPELADIDGDGDLEAFVMYGNGRVLALDFA